MVALALAPRAEPYWAAPLGINQSLGYRKIDRERGSWIARRKENARPRYRALGAATVPSASSRLVRQPTNGSRTAIGGLPVTRTSLVAATDHVRRLCAGSRRRQGGDNQIGTVLKQFGRHGMDQR
jgi:hypothetical protein